MSKIEWQIASGSRLRTSGAPGALLSGLVAGLLAIGVQAASAQGDREARYDGRRGAMAKPVMAIVSLSDQRISIYGADGKITESPVSSGATGYETPAGIFSIVQKKEMHSSNLYEDGEMPFMQRITWTGIALHAGNLPGHPASHGCIRLPMAFAERLFDMTEMGLRVVIVRDDMRPSDISHPALFKSKPVTSELGLAAPLRGTKVAALATDGEVAPGSARHLAALQTVAEVKAAEVETAVKRLREARAAASRTASEVAASGRAARAGESSLAQAQRALQDAERRLEKVSLQDKPQERERAEAAKTKAAAAVDTAQARLQAAKAQEQAKREAADRASTEAEDAAVAKVQAAQAAEEAKLRTFPVSVFVSRKTQRLYIRKGNYPVFEGPVTIRDAQAPVGTFIFTAVDQQATAPALRWTVVAMYRNPTRIEPPSADRRAGSRTAAAAPSDVDAATAALDRITFSQEALDIISDVVLPGSSLIISDEGPSRETGKDTDFVVVMSDEPQGALKIRQREPRSVDEFDSPWGGGKSSPWKGTPFFWKW